MGLFGFGRRMENSKGGAFFGVFLVPIAVLMLFWNEGRAVKRYKDLKEGAGAVVSIASDKVDSANEAKLVHLTGTTTTDGPVIDKSFGISETAIKLIRSAEMFQWVESKESSRTSGNQSNSEPKVSYQKEWRSDLVDSSVFVHKEGRLNPTQMKFSAANTRTKTVKLGAFTLPDFLITRINNSEDLPLGNLEKAEPTVKQDGKISGGGVYFGTDPANPVVGDTRVKFSVVRPGPVSAVAKQSGSTFAKYGTKTGQTLELLEIGTHEAVGMFQLAQDRNKFLTWMLRGVGFFMLGMGFSMILGPLAALSSLVPFLGGIVSAGTKLIGFLLAAIVWTITVGVSWIYYRPFLGIALLLCTAVLLFVVFKKLAKAKRETQPSVAGGPDGGPPPFTP